MPSIRLTKFSGIKPAVSDRLLDDDNAIRAHNTELRKGAIKAFKQPQLIKAAAGPVATVYLAPDTCECCGEILTWDKCVYPHPVELPGCAGFGLLTVFEQKGDAPYRLNPCTGERWPLCVPAPTDRLTATLITPSAGLDTAKYQGPDQRSYTYTWVDVFGVESAPAAPTEPTRSHDDETWTLSGFSAPPANAVAVRIYRIGSKLESGKNLDLRFDTTFQLVEELDIADLGATYVDARQLKDLCYGTLETEMNCCPPPCLCSVVELQSGYLAGYAGNRVHISQRYEHWNWPDENVVEIPEQIVGLVAFGDVLFVGTTGRPYRIALRPGAEEFLGEQRFTTNMEIVEANENYPAMTERTMVKTSFGAVYVSEKGLIALQPSGPAVNMTRARIDEDDWRGMLPNRLTWQNGVLYGTRAPVGEAFRFDIRSDGEGNVDLGDLVTIDMQAHATHTGRDGHVYYADGDGAVYKWDEGAGNLPYLWRSRKFTTSGQMMYSAAKVVADYGKPVTFTLRKERNGVMEAVFTRAVDHSRPFRIPHQGRGVVWQMEVEGTTLVHELHIATSVAELVERHQNER